MKLLENGNMKLRAPEPIDLELLYSWENDTDNWLVSNTMGPFSRHLMTQYIESAGQNIYEARQMRLMIDVYQNEGFPETVGCIDLFEFDPHHKRAGIGILISKPQDRRKGYAIQSLNLVMKYGFEYLQLHQLYCNMSTDNTKSIALFKKAGFEVTGTKKDWVNSPNGWQDEYLMQLINPIHLNHNLLVKE